MKKYSSIISSTFFEHLQGNKLIKTNITKCFHHVSLRRLSASSVTRQLSASPSPNTSSEEDCPDDGPLRVYQEKVASGELNYDTHQENVVGELQALHEKLKTYKSPKRSMTSWLWGEQKTETKGLYLYGSVGTGKTMLMDLFHNTSSVTKKSRVHFHKFMLDVHDRIHQVKLNQPKIKSTRGQQPFDAIRPVADEISQDVTLLCFDEFQVTDIADAAILKRLFTALFENGVIVVSTSNRHPDDLYKNGLQRGTFLPFIDVLKNHCDAVNLDSGIDYRRMTLPSKGTVYFVGPESETQQAVDNVVEELNSTNEPVVKMVLNIKKREVILPLTFGRMLDTTFDFLCRRNFGAIDYLEISKEFDIVVVRNVPRMNINNRTEARRFITLIDTLYDNRVKVVVSAEAHLEGLFDTELKPMDDSHHHMQLMDDLGIHAQSEAGKVSLFTGEEELFAFERIRSRLSEMQSKDYWDGGRSDHRTHGKKARKS